MDASLLCLFTRSPPRCAIIMLPKHSEYLSLFRTNGAQVLSVTPFEKVPLYQLLTENTHRNPNWHDHNQLQFKYF